MDRFTNERHSTTIGTIGLPRFARALLTLIGSCRIYYVFNIKARSTFSILPLQSLCQGNNLFEFACLGKILFTFWYHGFYYQRRWASSSFGHLFLNPRIGIFDPVYFDTRWVDPSGVCSYGCRNSPPKRYQQVFCSILVLRWSFFIVVLVSTLLKRLYINLYLTFYSTDWNEPGQWELSSQRILSARECRKYILPEVYVSLSLNRKLIFSLSRLP